MGIVQALELGGILALIGWGFGLAAALAWSAIRRSPAQWTFGLRLAAIAMATVIALSASYGYALVLDAADLIEYCDPLLQLTDAC